MKLLARSFLLFALLVSSSYAEEASREQPSAEEIRKSFKLIVDSIGDKPGQVKAFLIEKVNGTFAEPVFEKFPKLYDFIEELLLDEEAIVSLYSISADKTRLFHFALAMLATFIFAFLLKRFHNRGDSLNFFSALFKWIFRLCLIFSLRIGVFYYFFHKEIQPTIDIFKKTLL